MTRRRALGIEARLMSWAAFVPLHVCAVICKRGGFCKANLLINTRYRHQYSYASVGETLEA